MSKQFSAADLVKRILITLFNNLQTFYFMSQKFPVHSSQDDRMRESDVRFY